MGPPPVAYSHFFSCPPCCVPPCSSGAVGAGVAGPVKQVGRDCQEISPVVDTPSSGAEVEAQSEKGGPL